MLASKIDVFLSLWVFASVPSFFRFRLQLGCIFNGILGSQEPLKIDPRAFQERIKMGFCFTCLLGVIFDLFFKDLSKNGRFLEWFWEGFGRVLPQHLNLPKLKEFCKVFWALAC